MEEELECHLNSGSGSEEEEESEDEQSHQRLLDKVQSLTKRSRVAQRTEGAAVASQYNLPVQQDGGVSMESLLSGLGRVGSKSLLALRKRLGAVEDRVQPLELPLNKIQADKANRKAANEESCKEVGKWAPIIKKNREAEHLSFPLQQEHIPPPSLASKLESFKPYTELEKEVATILAASEHAGESAADQELTPAEQKSLFQMTVEEAMERKKALQRHRALVLVHEQKCRRIRRIKSKKFHKVQRKRLEKLGGKQVSEEELAKLRVKERMTLKHSSRAKWAKKQHNREHRDPATQQALSEHHNKKLELTQKVVQEEVNDSASEEELADTCVSGPTPSSNPWLNSTGTGIRRSAGGLIDTSSYMVTERESGSGDSGKRGRLGVASDQLLAVREAFSGDNVVEEFEREKAEIEAREMDKDMPVVLPGWGKWGGEGVRPPKRRAMPKPRPPRKPRDDAGLKHVIISEEKSNKKMLPHLVQSVPWPYRSKDQFNKTHSTPVGRHWNTEATFQGIIKPRVSTEIGVVIPPLTKI